ncbi:MAG: LamG domain-containing protein [Proteobacteria bacterium]|nr:LamG domain-containing protein [Pseudomonadota bacterium]
MKASMIGTWLVMAAALALSACGGGGAPVTANPVTTVSAGADYTGPAPTTADVQAFKINFWDNVRSTNRCGQCHNATSPGQLPNFARNDDVNLAYTQANTVVNLSDPKTSRIVAKVGGGHNCWLADPSACASILTTWITNWAGASAGGGTQIELTAPVMKDAGGGKDFPSDPGLFSSTVYPLLTQHCAACHSHAAAAPESPFFASSDLNEAYAAARMKMNLDNPAQSRLVIRLREESHNCWNANCVLASQTMQDAITAFANQVPVTNVDPALVISKALNMYDGTVASGGSRFDSNAIAKYEFRTGKDFTAYDTSGVDPAADLTLSGNVSWVGGWGLSFAAGSKAQAATGASKKLHDMILATGEFTIEAWVAPANVTQDGAYFISYSGGTDARNFTLGQSKFDYEAYLRSSNTDANGMPALATTDDARLAQASLQHVVVTYDPVNGRRIYVNGVFTGDADKQAGGTLSNWDNTFALVLGNEVSSNRSWAGVIRMVVIHNRALSDVQIKQNFAAGVGEKYFLLFNVEQATGVSKAYVMFQVSQYDSYSYLFNKPTFISLDPSAKPDGIVVKGIRIGINGVVPNIGQAYIPLSTTVTSSNYFVGQGQLLSQIGMVLGSAQGPKFDTFFLSFDQLGTKTHVVTEPVPVTPAPVDGTVVSDIGVRTFDRINRSLAAITSIPTTNANVSQTYQTVQQQLPVSPILEGFLSAHQVGIAQLAIQYCSELVNDAGKSAAFFPGVSFSAGSKFSTPSGRTSVISPLVNAALGINLNSQDSSGLTSELNALMGRLGCGDGSSCSAVREQDVTKAVCAAALGSAGVLVN